MLDLPPELWTQVFDLAADEDVIFQHGLPTAMAESAWFKHFSEQWDLRSPQQAVELVQIRSYATKKAIVKTCKQWRTLGSEFLYRCLFFSDPARLLTVCAILDTSSASTTATSSLGWWTRRIHLTRFHSSRLRGTTPESLQDALVSIIRHCPNLEIFIVDWPMSTSAFGAIADALATFSSKSLRTLHVNVPFSALPKVIWALDSLPRVFAAQLELEAPTPEDVSDETPLGAARDIHLHLPGLRQLLVSGYTQELLEQAAGWTLPALRHFSIDCGTLRADIPDTLAFLTAHGSRLVFLDLNGLLVMPLTRILAACPVLTSLAFNADWRVVVPDDEAGDGPALPFAHDRLIHVGLHGLSYAFGVGYAALHAETLPMLVHTSANDRTFSALCERARFPALRHVRVLSRSLLGDLERADGPGDTGGGMKRWEMWWETSRRVGVRLEDCTGGLLGVLPPRDDVPESEEDEEDDDDGEEGEESTDEDGEGEGEGEGEARWESGAASGTHLSELRKLLDECRAMDETRDENYTFKDPAVVAMFPDIVVTPAAEESGE